VHSKVARFNTEYNKYLRFRFDFIIPGDAQRKINNGTSRPTQFVPKDND
jgi:hypothetical protein